MCIELPFMPWLLLVHSVVQSPHPYLLTRGQRPYPSRRLSHGLVISPLARGFTIHSRFPARARGRLSEQQVVCVRIF